MSLPHFYDADLSFLNGVEGLEPIQEKHQIYFNFEPVRYFQLYLLTIGKTPTINTVF